MRSPSHALRSRILGLSLLLASSACARSTSQTLPQQALLAAGDRPALFLGPEPASAQIGYVSDDVSLELTAPPTLGRVAVRIEGPLQTSGYVAADQLSLRVQKRGRIRGTPAYVGPDDRVRVLGPEPSTGDGAPRLRVEVIPRIGERSLGRYEGSFPSAGLSVAHAPHAAEPPEPGVLYRVPAQLPVALFELPPVAPAASAGRQVAELAAEPEPYEVRVVRAVDGWLAVRAGSGPYLIGWTQAPLVPLSVSSPGISLPASSASAGTPSLPARLANEHGELRRVAPGTRVMFGNQVIGVFQAAGWARVQQVYPTGFVDVFAAADDGVALRGVVRSSDLSAVPGSGAHDSVGAQPAELSERSTPEATRSPAP